MKRTSYVDEQRDNLMRTLGKTFEKFLVKQSPIVFARVQKEMQVQGVPSRYLNYFVWSLGDSTSWPGMSKTEKYCLRLMADCLAIGNYGLGSLQIPEDEDLYNVELAISSALTMLAVWARRTWFVQVLRHWLFLLKKYAPQVPDVTEGRVPMKRAVTWLDRSFFRILTTHLGWFIHGYLILDIVSVIPRK